MGKVLTFYKVRAGINLPDDLAPMRAIDSTVLIVQEVFRQIFIVYERESRSVVSDSLRPHRHYTVHGILQARVKECVAVAVSKGFSQPSRSPSLLADFYQLSHQGSLTKSKLN